MRLGSNMLRTLKFAIKHQDEWCIFANNRATRNAIKSLEQLGLIKVNDSGQFKLSEIGLAIGLAVKK